MMCVCACACSWGRGGGALLRLSRLLARGAASPVQSARPGSLSLPHPHPLIVARRRSGLDLHVDQLPDEYKWILDTEEGLLKDKTKIISAMGFKKLEHSLPFFKLSNRTLINLLKTTNNDKKNNYCKNRLYYLSQRLQCDPSILSGHLSRRIFLYTLSFDWLEKSLDVLLDMGVPPERIVKDLWVIRYRPETIKKRLEVVKASGREDLAPWMVRCTEDVLERSIEIKKIARNILADHSSTKVYLAERLSTTTEVIDEMCAKIPAIRTMRVTKAKSFLDFLFSEGFVEKDIISVPRILAHSMKTIKMRLEKLRAIGVNSKNLSVMCKSAKDFKKYFESIEYHNLKNKEYPTVHNNS